VIGGTDIVFTTVGDPASIEACVRLVSRFWPGLRLEDAITGDKFARVDDVPFGSVRELLIYPDSEAEAAWDANSDDAAENSMIYLIARPLDITVVVDNPSTPEFQTILAGIGETLGSGPSWDQQIERDEQAGRLDALIDEAFEDHRAGRTRAL
jgi:hypothetical protein